MRISLDLSRGLLALVATLVICSSLAATKPAAAPKLDNASCLSCHESKSSKIEVPGKEDEKRALASVDMQKFGRSIHASMQCIDCHKEITDSRAGHVKAKDVAPPSCVSCHEQLWQKAREDNLAKEKARLGNVVSNIEAYKRSFHARPDADNPAKAKASCEECHSSHAFNIPPQGTAQYVGWRRSVPDTCGQKCHEEQLETYASSVHGRQLTEKRNDKAAVCTDCHSAHSVSSTSAEAFKTTVTAAACGTCHQDRLASYRDTYHGQVNALGYGYTAKCYDCHGSHGILEPDNPKAKVHPDNVLKTCRECHNGKALREATPGFTTFSPHANAHDFKKYPQVWIASKLMIALLAGVFLFFWSHTGLWYYREYKDRQERKSRPHVKTDELPAEAGKQVRRFGPIWRLAHLAFALATMALVLTGMTALFAGSEWAPVVARALGGAKSAALIHRVAATIFLGIFAIHLLYVLYHLLVRRRKTFRWFGPDSLVPNWQDLKDIIGMFKWFVGKGPRPTFDRWTYWEKFDYWAVFWGVAVIGTTGLMLAFPSVTASFFAGWALNVATLVHGEEAFLAAVFLFTVHFFNNHFRPDKWPPPDVVMFTGSVPLEEFRREHPAQYRRLLQSGELEKYLVDAPSQPMTLGSKILGLALIVIGLGLLVLVITGFFAG